MSGFYIKEILLDVILTKADVPVKLRLEKLPKGEDAMALPSFEFEGLVCSRYDYYCNIFFFASRLSFA